MDGQVAGEQAILRKGDRVAETSTESCRKVKVKEKWSNDGGEVQRTGQAGTQAAAQSKPRTKAESVEESWSQRDEKRLWESEGCWRNHAVSGTGDVLSGRQQEIRDGTNVPLRWSHDLVRYSRGKRCFVW